MTNLLGFAIFFAVFLAIYGGMHFYVFAHIAHGLLLPPPARTLVALLFVVGATSFFVVEILSRRTDAVWLKPLSTFAMVWLGVISLALSVFLLTDLVGLFVRMPQYRYYATLAGLGLLAVCTLVSLYLVYRGPSVKEITLPMPKLPDDHKEFVVVQLSDIHINALSSPRWLEGIVTKVNALKPDLIVITGDLIDSDICRFAHFCDTLKKLHAPYGVYGITGNHEYYTGIAAYERAAREIGMPLLRGGNVSLGGILTLVGIDDPVSARAGAAAPGIRQALMTPTPTDFSRPVILLSHRPDTFDCARELGIDLQLSGHTHAGQIPPLDLIIQLAFKYPNGLYHKGASYCYTTTGTGFWGPPMRLTSLSEIVKITLKKSE